MAASGKRTLTIGIPAYNEGQTIGRLVQALLAQYSGNFVLQSIVINSDGSSDDTVAACRALKSRRVRVIDNTERRGKAVRQTELFRLNQSDVHVCFDADVMPADPFVVSALVDEFSGNVGLVGGVVQALSGKTLLERTYIREKEIWHDAVSSVNGGANVYGHEGRISAVSRELAAAIEIPPGISGTDDYVYLFARTIGLDFRLAPKAVVLYQPCTSLADWRKQRRRFLASARLQTSLFGPEVHREFQIPMRHKLRAVAKALMQSPLLTSACGLLWLYGRIDAWSGGFAKSPVGWDIAQTTKQLGSVGPGSTLLLP